ncbi:YcaO-like family protein [Niallia sp. FSL R7-0648]|uniref:YcaO-like family protein n=1 Tax=Niallia sp. FSL R7-0648 TaxID=2954521 RepID=UPI0030FCC39D
MDFEKLNNTIINNKKGLISSVIKMTNIIGSIPLHAYMVHGKPVINDRLEIIVDSRFGGYGYSFNSQDSAMRKAIGEFIERYCSTVINTKVIKGSYTRLSELCLDPVSITRVSKEKNFNYSSKCNRDTLFYWVEGFNEVNKESTWIPSDLVYLLPSKNNKSIRDIISTGLATGNTLLQAKSSGLLECIERDAFTIMWQKKLSMPKINLNSIQDEDTKKIIKLIEELDLEIEIIEISNDLKVPTYLSLIKNSAPPFLSVGAKSHFEPLTALKGSLEEAAATFNSNVNKYLNGFNKDLIVGSFTEMDEHAEYYAFNNFNNEIGFLTNGINIDFNPNISEFINNYDELVNKLKSEGIEVYTVDLTTIDVASVNLYVVRTIVPKLAFLELNIPMNECERLNNVPRKLGYTIDNYNNELPHPFP